MKIVISCEKRGHKWGDLISDNKYNDGKYHSFSYYECEVCGLRKNRINDNGNINRWMSIHDHVLSDDEVLLIENAKKPIKNNVDSEELLRRKRSVCPMRLVNPPTIIEMPGIRMNGMEFTHIRRSKKNPSLFGFYAGPLYPLLLVRVNWPHTAARTKHALDCAVSMLSKDGYKISDEICSFILRLFREQLGYYSYGTSHRDFIHYDTKKKEWHRMNGNKRISMKARDHV